MLINEDRLQRALVYIAETDKPHAIAKAHMKGWEKQEKTIKGQAYLDIPKKDMTDKEREAKSYVSDEYKGWISKYEDAVCDYEILNNKRLREMLIIEVWRSLNSSRNKGNIT